MSHKGNRVVGCFPFFHYLCTMRLFEKILNIIFFTLLVHGCSEPVPVPDARLTVVDSLFIIEEDSAATALLEAVNPDSLSSTDYPLYCVLMLQAQDRNDLPMADTLVASAIAHYKHHDEDSYHAGLAWYYAGRIAYKQRDSECLSFFMMSEQLFDHGVSDRYLYLSRNFAGRFAKYSHDYTAAEEYFKKALSIAQVINKKAYVSTMYQCLSNVSSQLGNTDVGRAYADSMRSICFGNYSSQYIFYELYAISAMVDSSYCEASIYCDSMRYASKSLKRDSLWLNMIEADIALHEWRLREADERYKLMLLSSDVAMRRDAALSLSKVYMATRDVELAEYYQSLASQISDTMASRMSLVSLHCKKQQFHEEIDTPNSHLWIIGSILLSAVVIAILICILKRKDTVQSGDFNNDSQLDSLEIAERHRREEFVEKKLTEFSCAFISLQGTSENHKSIIDLFDSFIAGGSSAVRAQYKKTTGKNMLDRQLAILLCVVSEVKYDAIADFFNTSKQSMSGSLTTMIGHFQSIHTVQEFKAWTKNALFSAVILPE